MSYELFSRESRIPRRNITVFRAFCIGNENERFRKWLTRKSFATSAELIFSGLCLHRKRQIPIVFETIGVYAQDSPEAQVWNCLTKSPSKLKRFYNI